MRLTLTKMRISNFKGIRELEIDIASDKTAIYGANGTGKTSITDAFCWVLFDRDSRGNAPGSDNFRVKPLDDAGQEVHNLDTTVELECKLDGKAFNLKRTQRENWVRKRGSSNPVYNGNTSAYWVNGVETPLKDFKAKIAEVAPDEIFRLVGNLAAFNSQEWKKRREQLLGLSGNDVDDHLLAQAKYQPLKAECIDRNLTVDELRKALADQRKRVGNELKTLPVRIDEAKKALPDMKESDIKDAEYIANDCATSIEKLNILIAKAKAESRASDIEEQIAGLEHEIATTTQWITREWKKGKQEVEARRTEAATQLMRTMEDLVRAKSMVDRATERVKRAQEKRDTLRKQYTSVKNEKFTWTEMRTCPTCGQDLPEEKIQAAREAAQKQFDEQKAQTLADIKKQGSEAAADYDHEAANLAELTASMEELTARTEELQKRRDETRDAAQAYPAQPDIAGNESIKGLQRDMAELQAKLKETPDTKVQELQERKTELQTKLEEKQATIARFKVAVATKERIAQLEEEQKEAGARLVDLEQLIDLAEQFVTDRCSALEESINECFPTVRWKLFERQINGGINDICMCMIPCESGLVAYESANTAARINADLEIINVLSQHYDVYVPLFVDGAESVNQLRDTDSQLITLSVSTDAKLTVKKEEE